MHKTAEYSTRQKSFGDEIRVKVDWNVFFTWMFLVS